MLVGDLAGLPARGRPCFRNVFPQGDTSCLVAQLGLAARALADHGCSALGLPYPSVVRAAGWICWMWFGVVQGKNRSGGRRRTDRPDGILQDATARRTVILQDAAGWSWTTDGRRTPLVGTCTGVAATGQAGDHAGRGRTRYSVLHFRSHTPTPAFTFPLLVSMSPPPSPACMCICHMPACPCLLSSIHGCFQKNIYTWISTKHGVDQHSL